MRPDAGPPKHPAHPGRLRRLGERAGLLLLGTLLALFLLEVLLQAGALAVGPRRGPAATDDDGRRVVVALGDSHTYGVFYPPEKAYPGQLQAILDRRAPGRYRVVNLALPGMNSSEVVTRFPEWERRYRPWTSVLCVGVNNVWNEGDVGLAAGLHEPWWRHLRVVRLAALLTHRDRSAPPPEPPAELPDRPTVRRRIDASAGTVDHVDRATGEVLVRHSRRRGDLSLAEARALLRRDLALLADLHRRLDVRLVLLTYAAHPVPEAPARYEIPVAMNDELRAFAAADDTVDLVDVRDRFDRGLTDGAPRERLFHTAVEGHPNAAGYGLVADAVAEVLLADAD